MTHIESYHNVLCQECGEYFTNDNNLKQHMDANHNVLCQECGDNFTNENNLKQHMEAKHGLCFLCRKHGVLCELCRRKESIGQQRNAAKRKQMESAKKMVEKSVKRFRPAEVGDTVLVPTPDVDRCKIDRPQIAAIVLNKDNNSGMFQLGTRHGKLDQLYARNQFSPVTEKFLLPSEIPNNVLGDREASKLHSINGGQGVFRCVCNTKCLTNRCKCKKAGRTCNRRCHKNLTFHNHD